ncbi:hypothetical protein ES703_18931 [subsurface metagenome]
MENTQQAEPVAEPVAPLPSQVSDKISCAEKTFHYGVNTLGR